MPFEKGRSKTGGRQLGTPNRITATFRERAAIFDAEALETLASIMRDTQAEPSDRMTACSMLMDRAHGKPTAILEASVKTFDPDELSDADLAAIIAANGGGTVGAGDLATPPDQDEFAAVVPPRRLRTGKAPPPAAKKTRRRSGRKD
jgi:hypothetical protein